MRSGDDRVEPGREICHWGPVASSSSVSGVRHGNGGMHWTYTRVIAEARRLGLDDALNELDATYAHAEGGRVPAFEDVELDGIGVIPGGCILGGSGSTWCGERVPEDKLCVHIHVSKDESVDARSGLDDAFHHLIVLGGRLE